MTTAPDIDSHRAARTIVALTGPTAAGKTELALALAERLPVALISIDSAMVYRGMDIGTAKPDRSVLARHPHALIDIRDPADPYSAADFLTDADQAVREAFAAGRVPLLVGGTMLYLKAFREGLAPMPPADPALRASLIREAEQHGTAALYERLKALDPIAAEGIHPNNFSRIQRALEVQALSGRPISSFWTDTAGDAGNSGERVTERLGARLEEFVMAATDRVALHAQIERRFDAMLGAGFIDEVAGLKARGDLHRDLPAMRAVGYRQIWEYLDGAIDLSRMRDSALAATRQLAKRQLTWIRGWPGLTQTPRGNAAAVAAWIERKLVLSDP